MSIAEARSILLCVDHGEFVKVADYVDALNVCIRSGFKTVAAFLAAADAKS